MKGLWYGKKKLIVAVTLIGARMSGEIVQQHFRTEERKDTFFKLKNPPSHGAFSGGIQWHKNIVMGGTRKRNQR